MIFLRTVAELQHYIDAGQADNFYKWAVWKKLRNDVLQLDNYECQNCKKKGKYKKAVVVHHVQHLKDRPDLALQIYYHGERQLVSLCKACHEAEHPERIEKYRWKDKRKEVTAERWD